MHACAVDSEHVKKNRTLPLPIFNHVGGTKISENHNFTHRARNQFRRTAAKKLRKMNAQLFD